MIHRVIGAASRRIECRMQHSIRYRHQIRRRERSLNTRSSVLLVFFFPYIIMIMIITIDFVAVFFFRTVVVVVVAGKERRRPSTSPIHGDGHGQSKRR